MNSTQTVAQGVVAVFGVELIKFDITVYLQAEMLEEWDGVGTVKPEVSGW
ncbi:hypothetical protein [Pseudovibrio denitrificans]|nr:hypothetical protein [Pseudovibrio denitrificans]